MAPDSMRNLGFGDEDEKQDAMKAKVKAELDAEEKAKQNSVGKK